MPLSIHAFIRSVWRSRLKVMFFIGILLGFLLTTPTVNAINQNSTPNAGVYQFSVGDFKVATISDGLLKLPPLPTYAPLADPQEVEQAMVERFWSPDTLSLYFNALYVDTGTHHVLIDTGAGTELGTGLAKLAQNLAAIGIQSQDIDTVIITHAHPDHIGGIVATNGQLTFPNARYYISEAEWQFWMAPTVDLSSLLVPDPFKQGILASARKHLGAIASQVNLFQPDQEIIPGIVAIAAPGHTPGQSALKIESGGSQLIVAADVFFNEAFDLEHPDWQTGFDLNPQQAAETRRRLLNQVADERIMVMAYHMPFPALGHIRSQNAAPDTTNHIRYEWEPILWQFES
ncbi:MBL fold metallo-hydrolase [Oscillatoria sp. FACHB-1407]|uniref:MBL fold metallo-hydrolase n=1 Tax=Oscillatoria sp. FACHB-1407 TaxID=2692847 RepID=UPI00168919F1|nr:MBL fold metallo-hydrolase [Oscillatoria sp. FACHB-1407]MBD2463094.1 MBL fold metallo-hydrolase [Oscillatoria sp. FACHB-1407]